MHRIVKWLTKSSTKNSSERGAVTTIFAVVVLMGVLSGLFALVVDGGRIILERRVLQNSADAAAYYVAQQCVINISICSGSNPELTADNNSPDGFSAISEICGSSLFGACAPLSTNVLDCKSTMVNENNYVRIRTSTETPSGTSLTPIFSSLFGAGETSLTGCAQAKWAPSSRAQVKLPIAISTCDFKGFGSGNERIGPFTGTQAACTGSRTLDGAVNSGDYAGVTPIQVSNPDCVLGSRVSVGDSFNLVAPASMDSLCGGLLSRLQQARQGGEFNYIPVYSTSNVVGTSRQVTVVSFVRFKIVAFKYGSTVSRNSGVNVTFPPNCTNSSLCLFVQFTKGVAPTGKIEVNTSVPSLGVQAVELVP